MKKKIVNSTFLLILAILWHSVALAFKPGIHEDLTASILNSTIRVVDSEELQFSEKAIIEIRKANSRTDYRYPFTAYRHFDGESFSSASSHLINMKNNAISHITNSTPNGEAARKAFGTALHTLQDFYAHSNWIEIGNTSNINESLGETVMSNPSSTTAFCPDSPEVLSGAGLTQLTSGYYIGLLGCAYPPAGKCWHGGLAGCDGINKDEPGRNNYPTAATLASSATNDYLDKVLDAPNVNNNARAIKSFMDIHGTLGMVIVSGLLKM